MEECIFCKIAQKKTDTEIIKETKNFIVFPDKSPSAPIHFLIVPKVHSDDFRQMDDKLWVEVKKISRDLANEKRLSGFRLGTNAGTTALVKHTHFHFMAGFGAERKL